MEREVFLSGYCRCMDASRMVAVTLEDKQITDVDCNFGSCPYENDCALAQKIQETTM
jgi:hypothetical protein